MAQGTIKKPKSTPASARKTSSSGPKKGQRSIAPKRKNLIAQNRVAKKHGAGMIGKTERSLAEKAGHLELLAGGKKKGGSRKAEDTKKKNKSGNWVAKIMLPSKTAPG